MITSYRIWQKFTFSLRQCFSDCSFSLIPNTVMKEMSLHRTVSALSKYVLIFRVGLQKENNFFFSFNAFLSQFLLSTITRKRLETKHDFYGVLWSSWALIPPLSFCRLRQIHPVYHKDVEAEKIILSALYCWNWSDSSVTLISGY